jgi:hypothetical protein
LAVNGQGLIADDTIALELWDDAATTRTFSVTGGGVATFASTVKIGAVANYDAAARLEVVGESSTTNDLITSMVVNAKTTGTAAANVGTQMIFLGSMTGQNNVELGRIGFHNTNVSGAYGDFIIKTRPNGTSQERLRISSAGALGIAGANYGTDGQVLTSTGSGSAPAWEDAAGGGGFSAVTWVLS